MFRTGRTVLALGLALAAPAVASAIPQDPAFDLDKARDSLTQRGEPSLVGGVAMGRRIAVVGSAPGGGILLYKFGRDGVPRGATPLRLGEFAFADGAALDRAAGQFVIVGQSDGDLFAGRAEVETPRTGYQTSLARAQDVDVVAVATNGRSDFVALERRDGSPPEIFGLSSSGRPVGGFGSGGRRALTGQREVTALSVSPDGRTLLVGVLRPDFTTRVLRLDARTGALVRGADVEDLGSIRAFVRQGPRLFVVTGADDGRDKLTELDPESFAAGKSRRLQMTFRSLAQEPGGGVTICGESDGDVASCRRVVGGALRPLVPLGWGSGAQAVAIGIGATGSPVVVGAANGASRLAVGRDTATSVTINQSGGAELTQKAFARALRAALRSRRLPLDVATPEAVRVRVRLALGRRALDLRTFRVTDDGVGSTVVRLDGGDRVAIARARRGRGKARVSLTVTVTDGARNTAESQVNAVLS